MDCKSEESLNLLKSNPEELIKLVDKHVRVQLIKNSSFFGFVHSIDPITLSVILSVPQVNGYKTVLIPGHAVMDINEMKPLTDANPPAKKLMSTQEDNNMSKKEAIVAWLKFNLLPATEDGDNILFGNASLLPPYSVKDICTDNPMVAMQMRKLLEAMPLDFKPK